MELQGWKSSPRGVMLANDAPPEPFKPGMVAHTCNPNTQEVEAERSKVQS